MKTFSPTPKGVIKTGTNAPNLLELSQNIYHNSGIMEKNSSRHDQLMVNLRSLVLPGVGDEKGFLILILDANSDQSNSLKYFGWQGQPQFPHEGWSALTQENILLNDTIVSQKLKMPDVTHSGTLKDYFSVTRNPLQKLEKPVLKTYFNIDKDRYFSIPLSYYTSAHIIYKEAHKDFFERESKSLITSFQKEYPTKKKISLH